MNSKKKRTSKKADPVVQAGGTKIPTSTILAVVTAVFTGIGSLWAGQTHDEGLEVKVAKIEKDVEWIKMALSADEKTLSERRTQPSMPDSPAPLPSQQRPWPEQQPLLPAKRQDASARSEN